MAELSVSTIYLCLYSCNVTSA